MEPSIHAYCMLEIGFTFVLLCDWCLITQAQIRCYCRLFVFWDEMYYTKCKQLAVAMYCLYIVHLCLHHFDCTQFEIPNACGAKFILKTHVVHNKSSVHLCPQQAVLLQWVLYHAGQHPWVLRVIFRAAEKTPEKAGGFCDTPHPPLVAVSLQPHHYGVHQYVCNQE